MEDEYTARKIREFIEKTPIKKYPLITKAGEILLSKKELSSDETDKVNDVLKKLKSQILPNNIVIRDKVRQASLTPKEIQYLFLMLEGKSINKIAQELKVSPRTIEASLENIKLKTGYTTKAQLLTNFFQKYFIFRAFTMTDILDIDTLKKILDDFAVVRDWTKFHNPKNLSMALAAEAGELLEIFQWMPDVHSEKAKDNIEIVEKTCDELADVMLYLIRIAAVMNINLSEAISHKISLNNKKYPANLVKGSSKKYTQYPKD